MEFFALLAFIFSVYCVFKINEVNSRLKELQGEKTQPLVKQVVPTQAIQNTTPIAETKSVPSETTSPNHFFAWYAHEWPLKTGALFILLGFIWLVTYAFLNNWIGPVGRITFGILVGAVTLYFGEKRLSKVQSQGITLVGLGASIMIISVYSAQNIYEMFPPTVALIFFVIIMILTSVISLKHKVLSLSVASLIIGGLAPILIGAKEENIFGLYSYLLAITIGGIWIARYSKWKILTLLSLIIVSIYSIIYLVSGFETVQSYLTPTEIFQLRFFAVTFASIYFFASLASLITNVKPSPIDLQVAGAVGLFTFGWIHGLIPQEYKSVTTMAASLFYAFASYGVFVKTKVKSGVLIYSAIATILLAIATAFEFEGPALVIAFSLQALLLPIVGVSLLGIGIGKYFLLYFFLPGILSIEPLISASWNQGLLHNAFYSLTIVTLSFLISGMYFYRTQKEKEKPLHEVTILIIIIGSIYGLLWIWKVFHVVFTPIYVARMATLLLYTFLGLWAYATGEVKQRKILNKFGLFLIIFVIGRLLLIEIWNMELTMRIITFFVIGLLFIGSVLLKKSSPTKL